MAVFSAIVVCGHFILKNDKEENEAAPKLKRLENELLEQKENGLVLSELKSSTNVVCENKLSTLIDQLDSFVACPSKNPPRIITNPTRQLDTLAKELSICLATLLKFQERRNVTELFTSIIYRLPESGDNSWHWATTERGLSISDLIIPHDGRSSTFQQLLDSKGHSIFKNSKQAAYDANQYIPDTEDEYDENGKLKGSIACFQFGIKKSNKTLIEFVITITSYDQQFVQGKSDSDPIVQNVRHNLEKVVLPNYVVRAKIELCLLYIKQLHEKRILNT